MSEFRWDDFFSDLVKDTMNGVDLSVYRLCKRGQIPRFPKMR